MISQKKLDEAYKLAESLTIDKCRSSFWFFCRTLAPDFYIKGRTHLEILCNTLQKFYENTLLDENGKPYKKMIIQMPPRHGKSRTLFMFAAWILGKNNKNRIVTASYNDELAQNFSKYTRDVIACEKSDPLQFIFSDIFDARIKRGDASYKQWALDGEFFNYRGSGIGGTLTGMGANCFPAGTNIFTFYGNKDISTLQNGDRVLSYCHERNLFEWKRVRATKQRFSSKFVEITTIDGNRIKATEEHPVYVFGKGYTAIKDIDIGDKVKIFKSGSKSCIKMFLLWENIYKTMGRIYKTIKEWHDSSTLLSCMLCKIYERILWNPMYNMRKNNTEKQKILQRVPASKKNKQKIKANKVWVLWENISTKIEFYKVLQHGLQKQFSRKRDEGKRQSKLQNRSWNECLSERISKDEISYGKKRKTGMCCLRIFKGFSRTPSRQKSKEQHQRKSCCSLSSLSCNLSQVKDKSFCNNGYTEVYDIEVEDNHNFFANGILVHNCLIVDDPIKDAATAYNENALDKIWQWYTGTFISRGEHAKQIICQTPWSSQDIGGRLIAKEPELWYQLSMPACTDGVMLCNDILSKEEYDYLKSTGDEHIIAANYDLVRVDIKGALYGESLMTYEKLPDVKDRVCGYTDTADEGEDYLSSFVGVVSGTDFYVTDCLYTQEPQEITEVQQADMIINNKIKEIQIESNNGGRAFARNVDRILRERGYTCAVEWFHQSDNKIARINSNSSIVKTHVFFPENWNKRWPELYLALVGYQRAGKNKHDDAPDALTGVCEKYLAYNVKFSDDIIDQIRAARSARR